MDEFFETLTSDTNKKYHTVPIILFGKNIIKNLPDQMAEMVTQSNYKSLKTCNWF
jgi:predicted Rossmann-fold nucleotide-binding protein